MTLDAGGKGTFPRQVSATVQSATRCGLERPGIALSPQLCGAVPAFLRVWMPEEGFPPASSVMWPSPGRQKTKWPKNAGTVVSPP